MATVRFENVSRVYPGADRAAVSDLDLNINDGELLVLVGPSGCGKSTTLRMLAGLEDCNGGRIFIGDRDVTDAPPRKRDIAMVFQSYALYPHLTVRENIAFPLKIAKMPKDEIAAKVTEATDLLDLADLLDRKPKALSGGQRQRVAMGRAIVRRPQVFLLDEPLSNLDAKLRVQTRGQIVQLQRRLGVTTMHVTHDQTEAMTMGHRVAVLKDGVLQQCDTPEALYEHPGNAFVAGFIGSPAMNLLELPLVAGGAQAGYYLIPLQPATLSAASAAGLNRAIVGFRPEDMRLGSDGMALTVDAVEVLGADAYVYGTPQGAKADATVVVRTDGRNTPTLGSVVHAAVNPNHDHVFSPTGAQNRVGP